MNKWIMGVRKARRRKADIVSSSSSDAAATGVRITRIATEDDPVFLRSSTTADAAVQDNSGIRITNNNTTTTTSNNNNNNHIKSYQSFDQRSSAAVNKMTGPDRSRKRSHESIEMTTSVSNASSTDDHSSGSGDRVNAAAAAGNTGSGSHDATGTTGISTDSRSNSLSESFSSCLASLDDGELTEPSDFHQHPCHCPSCYAAASGVAMKTQRPAHAPPRIFVTDSDLGHGTAPVTAAAVRVRKVNLSFQEKININSLTGSSSSQPVFVLNGISMTVPRGAIYGLLGPSGCGKTSLLRCM